MIEKNNSLYKPHKSINSDIYKQNTTLRQDVEILSNPDLIVTDDMVINIVTKFFYAYRYPLSVDKKVSLGDIENLFWIWNFFFELTKLKKWTKTRIWDKKLFEDLNFYKENEYWIWMLWDIASTSKIFSQIIKEKLEIPENSKYVWFDLGAWTWIMLLAQKIQARRNRFLEENITNVWYEIQKKQAERANLLAQILNVGWVVYWDTTKKETYDSLEDVKISFITNETIPNPWISMTWENDPFLQNFENLYKNYWDSIDEKTRMFPRNILMNFKLNSSDGSTVLDREILANRNNKYWIDWLTNFEQMMRKDPNVSLWEDRRIFNHVTPIWISLWEKTIVKLEDIWKDLIESLKVRPLDKNRMKRRKDTKNKPKNESNILLR